MEKRPRMGLLAWALLVLGLRLQAPAFEQPAVTPARSTESTSSTSVSTPTTRRPSEFRPLELQPIDYRWLSAKIRLDRAFFSAGIVDDFPYEPRYRKAVGAFQQAHGLKVDGVVGPITSATLGRVGPLTREFVIGKEHFDEIYILPDSWWGKSLMPKMAYESILELVAERYHTSEAFLRRLNPGVDWDKLEPGAKVTVPWIRRRLPSFFAGRVEVDTEVMGVRVYDRDGKLRAFFNCSIGKKREVYAGLTLAVANAAEWPEYTFNPKTLGLERETSGKLQIPPGPNNPVGRAWVGLSKAGFGIHGTPTPSTIGRAESHGCIRLTNWDARSFFHMARIGVPVDFVGQQKASPLDAATTVTTGPAAAVGPAPPVAP